MQAVSFAEALISPAANADPAVQGAVKRGYWRHAPAARLAGLLELCRDALDCWQLRCGLLAYFSTKFLYCGFFLVLTFRMIGALHSCSMTVLTTGHTCEGCAIELCKSRLHTVSVHSL